MRYGGLGQLAAIAPAFAVCGAFSATMAGSNGLLFMGVPFALLAAVLCLWDRPKTAAWVAILYALTWPVAYFTTMGLLRFTTQEFLPICGGGIVGAFLLTFITAIAVSSLYTSRSLLTGAALGGIAAIPLALKIVPAPDWQLPVGFAIWQMVTGIFLYTICRTSRGVLQGRSAASL